MSNFLHGGGVDVFWNNPIRTRNNGWRVAGQLNFSSDISNFWPVKLFTLQDIGTQNFYYLYLLGILAEYLISYFGRFVAFSC